MPNSTRTFVTVGILVVIVASVTLGLELSGAAGPSRSTSSILVSTSRADRNVTSSQITTTSVTINTSLLQTTTRTATISSSFSYSASSSDSSLSVTSSNTTIPIPHIFGKQFTQVLGSSSAMGSGFSLSTNDTLQTNESSADLNCAASGGGGSTYNGPSNDYWDLSCYEVNSTGYQELLLDSIYLNLTVVSSNTYQFQMNAYPAGPGLALLSQSYNWTFGDGTADTSAPGEVIQHTFSDSTAHTFEVNVLAVAESSNNTSSNGQNWKLTSSFTISITVPSISRSSNSTTA